MVVSLLDARTPDDGQEKIDLIAHHALQAGDWARAFEACKAAGDDAIGRSALREAVGRFKQALVASQNPPETSDFSRRVIDLHFELRNALWALGQFEEILTHLDEAERLSGLHSDEVRFGLGLDLPRRQPLAAWPIGPRQGGDRARPRDRESAGDLSLEMAANFYLGCAYVTSGECRTAEAYFERVVAALPGDLAKEKCGLPFAPAIISRSWLVWSYGERGEFGLAQEHADRAIELAEEIGNPFNRAHVYYDVGYLGNRPRRSCARDRGAGAVSVADPRSGA